MPVSLRNKTFYFRKETNTRKERKDKNKKQERASRTKEITIKLGRSMSEMLFDLKDSILIKRCTPK